MDILFCDELLQEIFRRLPPSSAAAVALVSRRWRRLLRSSTTSLSLNFPPPYNPTTITSFSSFLYHHPFLSSLSASAAADGGAGDHPLLLSVAASCPNLRHLRLFGPPVSSLSLSNLSKSFLHLSSLSVAVLRPFSLNWLPCFSSLTRLSLSVKNPLPEIDDSELGSVKDSIFDVELRLESLSLSGISQRDYGVAYLWRNCKNVTKLELNCCEGLGDFSSFSDFLRLASDLQELELRSCRSVANLVLFSLSENCVNLNSLLIYDGGSREGLLHFLKQGKCSLRSLDLRLPLDLDNSHMLAISENFHFRGLMSLKLQSCCFVTGEGLRAVGRALNGALEELSLINCDVVVKERGLLTTLGQDFNGLKRLDLSYNGMLVDKEVVSMLASCDGLVELRLRGCSRLSDAVADAMVRRCKRLQVVDVACCCGIRVQGVEIILLNSLGLRRVEVERNKLSEAAMARVADRFVEVVC
ncbi:F-box/LRR-repeat protein 3-like isoform X1 [Salvia hispanica]|uniref:F-box/LRR-repeat protein 3-like isoform X1 n=1 Tax=Salvia hispanica TaxID=49212 RepID=UPI0020097B07|nr:F-box/LRR-repeat protein 3-like isoform X1 [Salvia hispanica]